MNPILHLLLPFANMAAAQAGGAGGLVRATDGADVGDLYGSTVAIIGDVDFDGVDDYAVGAPLADSLQFVNAGTVSVYSGASGQMLYQVFGTQTTDSLGISLAAAGDVNTDGVPDFIVGSVGLGNTYGAVSVFSGNDGTRVHYIESNFPSFFGRVVSTAGDWNADGYDDFVVGAQLDGDFTGQPGSVTVFSGLDASILAKFYGRRSGDLFGISVVGGVDLNSDSVLDLIVGAGKAQRADGSEPGAVVAINGATGESLWTALGGPLESEGFGLRIAIVSDITGDGVDELVSGNSSYDASGNRQAGQVVVLSGRTGSRHWQRLGTFEGQALGEAVASSGDANGDGVPDVLISAQRTTEGDPLFGAVYLHSGVDGGLIHAYYGSKVSGLLGRSLSGASDFNQDGRLDFLAGAPNTSIASTGPGSVKVLSFDSFLAIDQTELSLSNGGAVQIDLDFPKSEAKREYALLASTSGVRVRWLGGIQVPLQRDKLFDAMVSGQIPPYFDQARGVLDDEGNAVCNLLIPANAPASARDRRIHVAAVTVDPLAGLSLSSSALTIRFVE